MKVIIGHILQFLLDIAEFILGLINLKLNIRVIEKLRYKILALYLELNWCIYKSKRRNK